MEAVDSGEVNVVEDFCVASDICCDCEIGLFCFFGFYLVGYRLFNSL